MRIDSREVELARDQEDHGADGREEPAIAARLALGGLEESIQSLEEAIRGTGPGLGTDAFQVGSHETGHRLHGLDLGAADVRAPLLQHQAHDVHLLAIQDLAELLAVHPGPGRAFGCDRTDPSIEVRAGGGI